MKRASQSHGFPGFLLGLLFVFVAEDALAIGSVEIGDGAYTMEAIGSGRLTGAFFHYPTKEHVFPEEDDGLGSGVLRLILEGDLGAHTDYEIHVFTALARSPEAGLGGAFSRAGSSASPYRYPHLSLEYWDDGYVKGDLGIDRFVFQVSADPVSLSMGRMPINYGVTNIFTPNDFFAPFSVAAINTIYKPGVDAVKLAVETGMLSSVELVGVLGYDEAAVPDWADFALLLRMSRVFGKFEWALLGGKLAERWVVGGSMQGEIGRVGVRGEGHLGFRDVDGDGKMDHVDSHGSSNDALYARFAFGVDILFAWHNASIGAEYLFLSDGMSSPANYWLRLGNAYPDDQMYLGNHYGGISLGADIVPILRLNTMGLVNARDGSGLAGVSLAYNISDESDFILGALVPFGERPRANPVDPGGPPILESEYGTLPFTVYFESRFYF